MWPGSLSHPTRPSLLAKPGRRPWTNNSTYCICSHIHTNSSQVGDSCWWTALKIPALTHREKQKFKLTNAPPISCFDFVWPVTAGTLTSCEISARNDQNYFPVFKLVFLTLWDADLQACGTPRSSVCLVQHKAWGQSLKYYKQEGWKPVGAEDAGGWINGFSAEPWQKWEFPAWENPACLAIKHCNEICEGQRSVKGLSAPQAALTGC